MRARTSSSTRLTSRRASWGVEVNWAFGFWGFEIRTIAFASFWAAACVTIERGSLDSHRRSLAFLLEIGTSNSNREIEEYQNSPLHKRSRQRQTHQPALISTFSTPHFTNTHISSVSLSSLHRISLVPRQSRYRGQNLHHLRPTITPTKPLHKPTKAPYRHGTPRKHTYSIADRSARAREDGEERVGGEGVVREADREDR